MSIRETLYTLRHFFLQFYLSLLSPRPKDSYRDTLFQFGLVWKSKKDTYVKHPSPLRQVFSINR